MEAETPGSPWKVVLRCGLMNLAAALLVLGSGEAFLRALPADGGAAAPLPVGSHDPGARFRWFQVPLVAGNAPEFDHWVTNNRYGFNGPDHPPRREPGKRRVAVLGDSFIEAFQVGRGETIGARLESALPGTEVLDFGEGACSTTRQVGLLDRLPGLLRDDAGPDLPDVVVFQCHGRYSLLEAISEEVLRPALWRRGLESALYRVRVPSEILARVRISVLRRLAEPREDLLLEADRFMERGFRSDVAEAGWAALERSIRNLADRSRALRVRPVFAYLPGFDDLLEETAALDPGIPARRFRDMVGRAGADFVDLTGGFRRALAAGERPLHFREDRHLTPLGHEVAARGLAAALRPMLEGR